MKKKNRRKKGICTYCGKEAFVTRDHIPPKNIFPKPQPNNVELITVPACKECNHELSKDEEEFKLYISLKCGMDDTPSLKLHKSTRRTVQNNNKLKSKLINNTVPMYLPTNILSGYERQVIYNFHSKPVRNIAKKILKGLYFKHFGKLLNNQTDELDLYLPEELNPEAMISIEQIMKHMQIHGVKNIIGNNQEFAYWYSETTDNLASIWILIFNMKSVIYGMILPKENNN